MKIFRANKSFVPAKSVELLQNNIVILPKTDYEVLDTNPLAFGTALARPSIHTYLFNSSTGTITLAAGASGTFRGTATMASGVSRHIMGVFTSHTQMDWLSFT